MLSTFALASLNATSTELGRLPDDVPPRRLAEGRGRGRGILFVRGRGRGRGTVKRSLLNTGLALPVGRAPANERVCYPLPPADARAKQGQVLEGTSFGAALSAIASRVDVVRVLELGTWYGGGSTVNLGRGVRESARATLAASLGASAPADNCIDKSYSERCCHSLVRHGEAKPRIAPC